MSKHIPLDRLAFYTSAVRDKNFKEYVVSFMPFDLKDIEGLPQDKKWEVLQLLSVEFLKDTDKISKSSHHTEYVRSGSATYQEYKSIESLSIRLSKKEDKVSEITEVFHNAFDKIILPAGYKDRLIETVSQLKDHKKIFDTWGLGEKIKRGRGINILLSGVSGTGKTYCGEVVAEYLGIKCDIISVASIESKYVGESEKNVATMFEGLGNDKKLIVLDEVDSFLVSRSSVSDSNQHHGKLTNQFLIELERHNGIVIMTTNRPVKLDKALARRIDLVLDFPFPDTAARERIWRHMIPSKMPTDKINFESLALHVLNGGQIKNAVLSTARKAVTKDLKKIPTELFKEAAIEIEKASDTLINGKDNT